MREDAPLSEWAETAASDQDAVVEHVPEVVALLDDDDATVRNDAVTVLSRVAKTRSDAVLDALPALIERLEADDQSVIRHNSALALSRLVENRPEACRDAIEPLVRGLTDGDGDVREKCGRALDNFGPDAAGDIEDASVRAVEDAADRTGAETSTERNEATLALTRLALRYPEEVATHTESLRDRLDDEDNVVRYHATLCLNRIAKRQPHLVVEAVEPLADRLDDPDADVRALASEALASVSEDAPGAVTETSGALADALTDSNDEVRAHAVGACRALVAEYPDVVLPAQFELVDLLADARGETRVDAKKVLHGLADAYPDEIADVLASTRDEDLDTSSVDAVHGEIEAVAEDADGASATDAEPPAGDEVADEAGEKLRELAAVMETAGAETLATFDDDMLREFLTLTDSIDAEAVSGVDAGDLAEMRETVRTALDIDGGDGREASDPATDGEVGAIETGWDEDARVDPAARPDDGCSYGRDLGEHAREQDDDVWTCHRSPREGGEYCLFHAPVEDTDDEAVRDAFLEAIQRPGRGPKEFVGARFGDLNLSFDIVDGPDNYPIDLRYATVEGSINCRRAEFGQPLWFEGGRVAGGMNCNVVTFKTWASFEGTTMEHAWFGKSEFRDGVSFDNATIREEALFTGATFTDRGDFEGARFGAHAEFSRTVFDSASFEHAHAAGTLDLGHVVCDRSLKMGAIEAEDDIKIRGGRVRNLRLSDADVDGDVSASKLTVEKTIHASDARVGGTLSVSSAEVRQDVLCQDLTAGGVDFDAASVAKRFSFQRTRVAGDCAFSGVSFGDVTTFQGAEIDGDMDLSLGTFEELLTLREAEVGGSLEASSASVGEQADFVHLDVGGDCDLSSVTFGGTVMFFEGTIEGGLDISSSRFEGQLSLSMTVEGEFDGDVARFEDDVNVVDTSVGGPTTFSNATFGRDALFQLCELRDACAFDDAEFAEDASFAQTVVEGPASFETITVGGVANFDGVNFESGAAFFGSTFADLTCLGTRTGDGSVVDMRNCEIADGAIALPDDGDVAYDLANAELGAVELSDGLGETSDVDLFEYFRFANTSFDGFDFGNYKQELAEANWQLHTTVDDAEFVNPGRQDLIDALAVEDELDEVDDKLDGELFDEVDHVGMLQEQTGLDRAVIKEIADAEDASEMPSSEALYEMTGDEEFRETTTAADLENTYLKAKNGADQVGDRHVAAQFFVQEMKYRRAKNYRFVRDPDQDPDVRLVSAGKWFGNYLLHQSCGYGERLWRVIYASVVVVVGWSFMYATLTEGTSGDAAGLTTEGLDGLSQLATPEGADIMVKNLYFSIVTFTTLGYGDIQPVGTLSRFLAGLESFLGALLVALVVFVLGRRVSW
ncbi:pentapeptide repeat-containing protein [Halorubrum sp. SP3]|uniref:pentapeptide repeat-containing protein n=1 Tax=Halorubrum sp. SP3 TaxID=1537265 RepID=UPI0013053B59|nr:pentapeptide repeat-containing protein [Halorubrum sp. SP3]